MQFLIEMIPELCWHLAITFGLIIKFFIENTVSTKDKDSKTEILRQKAIDLLEEILYDTEEYQAGGLGQEARVFEDSGLKLLDKYFADALPKEDKDRERLDFILWHGKL